MKRLILAAAFMFGVSCIANAQVVEKKSPEQRAAHITKALTKKLSLSQEQAKQVNTILLTQATRMDSLKTHQGTDKKGNQLAAKTIHLDAKKQVVAVLTAEQKEKFGAWEKMRKEKHHGKRPVNKADTEG